MTTAARLEELGRQRPEWRPWLAVVEVALAESAHEAWNDAVPAAAPAGAVPRLQHAALRLRREDVGSYLERLFARASKSGTREMATLARVGQTPFDALALFRAALCDEQHEIAAAAARSGADPGAFRSVMALLPLPFLQACARAWPSPHDWVESYCPTCGSWPALAEVRGIERSRYYRCGRCGSAWQAHMLVCPFCSTTDHRNLVRLVPGDPAASSSVEACLKCRGYLKTFNTLQGYAPGAVMLEDLASVALDLSALDQGYSRPPTPGYTLDVTIAERPARRRFLA